MLFPVSHAGKAPFFCLAAIALLAAALLFAPIAQAQEKASEPAAPAPESTAPASDPASPATAQNAPAAPLKHVTILPQWEPQAQFAGIYMAKEKGIYEKYGLDVTILRGGPKAPTSVFLQDGRTDFTTMFLSTAVKLAADRVPIVNLAQIIEGSTLLIIAKKSRGFHYPKDLDGKRVSTWGGEFSLEINEFFRKHRVAVETLPQGYTINLFLRDGVDAVSGMRYNEYHALLNAGLDPDDMTVFSMADSGLGFPEDGLYCLRKTYEADPETCCKMARATMEGWRYAFAHPEETLGVVMRKVEEVKLPTNHAHQKWMLEHMRQAIAPDGQASVHPLSKEQFMNVAKALYGAALLPTIPSYEEFHVDCQSAP